MVHQLLFCMPAGRDVQGWARLGQYGARDDVQVGISRVHVIWDLEPKALKERLQSERKKVTRVYVDGKER